MKLSALVAVLVAYCAMLAAFWVQDSVFEDLPKLEDEIAYIYQAKIFAGGRVYMPVREPARAYWQPFMIECGNQVETKFDLDECAGKVFSKYPPGWSLILAGGYLLHMEWAVNPLFFMLTIALTYRLAREIFGEAAGVLAAILLAASPIAWLNSGTWMAHPAAMFFTVLALYGIWRLEHRRRRWLWAVLAGMALGMLVAIRPLTGFSLALPLVAYSGIRLIAAMIVPLWGRRPVAWWLRLGIVISFIIPVTLVAYWAAQAIPFWSTWFITAPPLGLDEILKVDPAWSIALVGGLLAILATLWATADPPWMGVNPPLVAENARLRPAVTGTLLPLLVVGLVALLFGTLWPAYNFITTGNLTQNLYLLVWDYDRIGFGPGHGRWGGESVGPQTIVLGMSAGGQTEAGHNLDRAKRHLEEDMQCYTRDLFGWVEYPDDRPASIERGNDCMVGSNGVSLALLPLVVVLGWRRRWTWVLLAAALALIGSTMLYWIGAAVYSARYYYEATAIFAILTAGGVVALADHLKGWRLDWGIYTALVMVVCYSLLSYNTGRMEGVSDYGLVGQWQIEAVDRWRFNPERPVLIIAYGSVGWRDVGALMALTSPYLDSEYVLLRDPDMVNVERLKAMFPNHDIVYFKDGQFLPSLSG